MIIVLDFPLPFDVRYLPVLMAGVGLILILPATAMMGRWSGWRQIAARYPDRNAGRGTSFRSGKLIVGTTIYKTGARFTADDAYLHAAMSAIARPGHRPFSIPWGDITATPDAWPWFPFKGYPMVRLTLAGEPDVRILLRAEEGARLAEASGGRLSIEAVREPAAAAR